MGRRWGTHREKGDKEDDEKQLFERPLGLDWCSSSEGKPRRKLRIENLAPRRPTQASERHL